jgi:hypothetical protein
MKSPRSVIGFPILSLYIKRIATILFPCLLILGCIPLGLIASPRLPNIPPEMEKPEFWIKKTKNPTHLILTPAQIHKMNEVNLKRQELLLCRIGDLKEDWTKEEILSFLKEDWENFGRTEEVRYGKSGIPLGEIFWNELRNNLNQESVKDRNRMLFGLILKRTDIRVFPTDECSLSAPQHDEFDLFQHSSISPGSPVGIYHFTKEKEWVYVQTPFIRGWVRTHDLAIAREKGQVADYEGAGDRLMVTGNFFTVFADPSLRQPVFLVQMGDSFPLVSLPHENKTTEAFYIIHIPARGDNGWLTFRKGYVRAGEDVHQGFPPYTQENVALQAFKMLNHPYGWGDMLGGRDCSRFILDLFRTFGILMPRNSKEQAMVGIDLGRVEGQSIKEKSEILKQAIPLATTLRLPGHIMLYLGKDRGKHYVIHSLSGIQRGGKFGPISEKIGKVVISDLSLGESGFHGSLFRRLTGVRLVGVDPHLMKPYGQSP